jgi:uncharacterized protein YjbI with pentapeptide repeats
LIVGDLSNADLELASFNNANLTDVIFNSSSYFVHTDFFNSTLTGVRFPPAYYTGAKFTQARVEGLTFPTECGMSQETISDSEERGAGFIDKEYNYT